MSASDQLNPYPGRQIVLAIAPATIGRLALLLLAFLAVWFAGDVLLVIFGGILFGVLLRAAAGWIQKKTGLGPRASYLLLVAAIALILGVSVRGWAAGFSTRHKGSKP